MKNSCTIFDLMGYSIDHFDIIKFNNIDFELKQNLFNINELIKNSAGQKCLHPLIESDDKGSKITIKEPGINKENTNIDIKDLGSYFLMTVKSLEKQTEIKLSKLLNTKKIKAECKDGILVIEIPKKKENSFKVDID